MKPQDMKKGSCIIVRNNGKDNILGIVEHLKTLSTMIEIQVRSQEINATEAKHFKINLYMNEFDS
ncbi:MAG: hypothetical protein MPEBLZ_04328 [Candidatus Methanoperedens nitroreducens]|uniref:Uncharacterized protein n=1 Tax=Candidatus Methanoperedens nitratireducens TaxID=1392998 RepID=A0A0P8A3Z7_9EURY|nr:hypothetical protein [Candidatus Methanoperedens sp. BLZ2]KAB2944317.1 MAG: hypothetical protein F9K14_14695 [Candidatus Methanoperedens sp.]KPQ41126.1 MAG: hypothetical protein MPEBLZ_04328 [Candidatus Methanoperedens sp. BLZ1]MBZ0175283.1 hypothetical protein [Candidatus Methanoperedens nitroreducens]MCX9079426.1 hypothetical protein [Candidatus Methanoperedens sp.]